jgi:hypothetical protein
MGSAGNEQLLRDAAANRSDLADLRSAGFYATAPGGSGTSTGMRFPLYQDLPLPKRSSRRGGLSTTTMRDAAGPVVRYAGFRRSADVPHALDGLLW